MNQLLYFLLLGILLSCKPTKNANVVQNNPINTSPIIKLSSEKLISIEKGACFGRCPIYKLQVHNDGSMVLEGKQFIEQVGPHVGMLDQSTLKNIKTQIEKLDWASFPEMFPTNISDLPSSKLVCNIYGKSYATKWSHGAPEDLAALAESLHQISKNHAWEKDPDVKVPEGYIAEEIIVKLHDVENLSSFLEEFQSFGVTVKEQLVPKMPIYNCNYDDRQAYPFEMLKMIKSSRHVKMAEFNKTVKLRD